MSATRSQLLQRRTSYHSPACPPALQAWGLLAPLVACTIRGPDNTSQVSVTPAECQLLSTPLTLKRGGILHELSSCSRSIAASRCRYFLMMAMSCTLETSSSIMLIFLSGWLVWVGGWCLCSPKRDGMQKRGSRHDLLIAVSEVEHCQHNTINTTHQRPWCSDYYHRHTPVSGRSLSSSANIVASSASVIAQARSTAERHSCLHCLSTRPVASRKSAGSSSGLGTRFTSTVSSTDAARSMPTELSYTSIISTNHQRHGSRIFSYRLVVQLQIILQYHLSGACKQKHITDMHTN
jgi:hypothetical protein